MAWTEKDWDHEREGRKHDWKADFRTVDRFKVETNTAMDVALVVRGMSNLYEAGKLIDAYADAKAAAIRLDAVAAGARP